MDATQRETDLVALGHPGNDHFAGLESFPNPGRVARRDAERRARRGLPGHRPARHVHATIEYSARTLCLESKSLKLYLNSFRNEGAFCEALAVTIRDDVAAALGLPHEDVRITLVQKPRGGNLDHRPGLRLAARGVRLPWRRPRPLAAIAVCAALVTPAAGCGAGSSSVRLQLSRRSRCATCGSTSASAGSARTAGRRSAREERSTQGRLWRSSEGASAGADGTVALRHTLARGTERARRDGIRDSDRVPGVRSRIQRRRARPGSTCSRRRAVVRLLRPGRRRASSSRRPRHDVDLRRLLRPGRIRSERRVGALRRAARRAGCRASGRRRRSSPHVGTRRSRSRTSASRVCRPSCGTSRSSTSAARSSGFAAQPQVHGRGSSSQARPSAARRAAHRRTYPELVRGVIALVPTTGSTVGPGDR